MWASVSVWIYVRGRLCVCARERERERERENMFATVRVHSLHAFRPGKREYEPWGSFISAKLLSIMPCSSGGKTIAMIDTKHGNGSSRRLAMSKNWICPLLMFPKEHMGDCFDIHLDRAGRLLQTLRMRLGHRDSCALGRFACWDSSLAGTLGVLGRLASTPVRVCGSGCRKESSTTVRLENSIYFFMHEIVWSALFYQFVGNCITC